MSGGKFLRCGNEEMASKRFIEFPGDLAELTESQHFI